ncbi:Beta-cyclopiazonate dehydrogenase [Madurella fahalii]|uniref:Beta-cyclopiazonate dehydrogenase n=1 Tax=Madurella fahalii TaxID=1157608 RepID=A0ABQ0G4Y3_9PEZI
MKSCMLLAVSSVPLSSALASRRTNQFDPESYASRDVITRDVAVIGGGSSGTYSAINLLALGKSVVVIERDNRLGGHTSTYVDPATGVTVNYGVQAFYNISVATDYFSLLGVPMGPFQPNLVTRAYADFQTGRNVSAPASPGFGAYAEQLHRYPYLGYGWDLPSPVPEDLLLPFGEFVAKYNLQDVAYSVYFSGQGFANILQQLTVNVFKMIDDAYLNSIAGASMMPVSGNNGEMYDKALSILGSDALLSSTVVASKRPSDRSGVRLVVKTRTGRKLIKASKLLITIPPLLNNLAPFDLGSTERRLFSQWSYTNYFIMLVNNTGLPSRFQVANAVPPSAGTLSIPNLPAPYQITETRIPGLFYVWYGSPRDITEAAVKADVAAVITRLRPTFNSTVTTPPRFVEFRSHTPFKLVVPAEAIAGGFYQELEALQGHRNTWYTGAAFISHSASIIWNFTHSLLPDIAA